MNLNFAPCLACIARCGLKLSPEMPRWYQSQDTLELTFHTILPSLARIIHGRNTACILSCHARSSHTFSLAMLATLHSVKASRRQESSRLCPAAYITLDKDTWGQVASSPPLSPHNPEARLVTSYGRLGPRYYLRVPGVQIVVPGRTHGSCHPAFASPCYANRCAWRHGLLGEGGLLHQRASVSWQRAESETECVSFHVNEVPLA